MVLEHHAMNFSVVLRDVYLVVLPIPDPSSLESLETRAHSEDHFLPPRLGCLIRLACLLTAFTGTLSKLPVL